MFTFRFGPATPDQKLTITQERPELNRIKSLRYSAPSHSFFNTRQLPKRLVSETISSIKPLNYCLSTAVTGPTKMKISGEYDRTINEFNSRSSIGKGEDGSRIVTMTKPTGFFFSPLSLSSSRGITPSKKRRGRKKTQ